MTDERNRLNKIIDDHGLNIEHVQVMERRDQSYSRVYDALAAKLAEVDAARSAVIRMSVAEISDLKAALKTARRDALEEAAEKLRIMGDMGGMEIVRALIEEETKP